MNNDALRFDIAPKEAVALQKELRTQVRLVPLAKEPHIIGGCDVSMNRFAIDGFAGFVNLSYPELEMTGESVIKDRIPLPYIPGLLSFREMPMLMKAWEALAVKPDVLMVDGIGIAHPRRLGIASLPDASSRSSGQACNGRATSTCLACSSWRGATERRPGSGGARRRGPTRRSRVWCSTPSTEARSATAPSR